MNDQEAPRPTLGEVLCCSAEACGVTMEELASLKRSTGIAHGRSVFACAAYEVGYSFEEIGAAMGRESHTTANVAYQRVMRGTAEYRAMTLNTVALVLEESAVIARQRQRFAASRLLVDYPG